MGGRTRRQWRAQPSARGRNRVWARSSQTVSSAAGDVRSRCPDASERRRLLCCRTVFLPHDDGEYSPATSLLSTVPTCRSHLSAIWRSGRLELRRVVGTPDASAVKGSSVGTLQQDARVRDGTRREARRGTTDPGGSNRGAGEGERPRSSAVATRGRVRPRPAKRSGGSGAQGPNATGFPQEGGESTSDHSTQE